MDGRIKITPEQMNVRANEYITEAGKMQEIVSTMDRLIGELEDEWEGQTSKSFSAQYRNLRPSFLKGKMLVEVIASQLNNIASGMTDVDNNLSDQIGIK